MEKRERVEITRDTVEERKSDQHNPFERKRYKQTVKLVTNHQVIRSHFTMSGFNRSYSNSGGSSARRNPNQQQRSGGGGGGGGRLGQKIFNSLKSAATGQRQEATTTTTSQGAVVVGTQALALQRMNENAKKFKYPSEGFVSPIEHSLLYAMICEPTIYPEPVVLAQIENEDFNSFLEIAQNEDKTRASYAQLSALLLKSAEKFPDVGRQDYLEEQSQNQDPDYTSSSRNRNSTRDYYDDDSDNEEYSSDRSRNQQQQQQQQTESQQQQESQTGGGQQQKIPQALCKAILSCVTKYADKHGLDRATEVKELLEPVEASLINQNSNSLLPIYVAYSVGLFIPGGIGLGLTLVSLSAMIAAADKATQNVEQVSKMNSQRHRVANLETAGLLDEMCEGGDDDYDDDEY